MTVNIALKVAGEKKIPRPPPRASYLIASNVVSYSIQNSYQFPLLWRVLSSRLFQSIFLYKNNIYHDENIETEGSKIRSKAIISSDLEMSFFTPERFGFCISLERDYAHLQSLLLASGINSILHGCLKKKEN